MYEATKGVKQAEEENKHLDNPVALPQGAAKIGEYELADSDDFFFRPPKGIKSNPEPPPEGILFVYPSASGAFEKMYLCAVKTDKSARFQADFLQSLKMPGVKFIDAKYGKVEVKYYHSEGKKNPYLYVYETSSFMVGIALFPGETTSSESGGNVDEILKYSLASLAIGPQGFERRRKWKSPGRSERSKEKKSKSRE
jgi:hypothetical protein